jgi:hypothetical protein
VKTVALHDAGKPSALGLGDYVHQLTGLEYVHPYVLANLEFAAIVGLHFSQVTGVAARLQVPGPGFVEPFDLAEPQLHRRITVSVIGLDLGHHAWPRLYNRNRDDSAVVTENLGHANLPA